MRLGKYVFKKYDVDKPSSAKFKHGGWSGILLYHDNVSGEMYVGRTMHLSRYLSNMNFMSIKKGSYGKFPQTCTFNQLNIYYLEVEQASTIRDVQNEIRRIITAKNKPTPPQSAFDFDKKIKKKILKGEEVQVGETFIQASVEPTLDSNVGKVISVVYRDKFNRRCTMFASVGTPQAAEQLVKMINATVKVVETNVVHLDRMTLEEFQNKHKLTMTVRERSPNDLGSRWRPELRFFASFDNCNVVEKGCLCGVSGDGATEQEAIRNYGKNISEKTLRVDSLINVGKDFKVPVIID